MDDELNCEECENPHHKECSGDLFEGSGEYPEEDACSYCKNCTSKYDSDKKEYMLCGYEAKTKKFLFSSFPLPDRIDEEIEIQKKQHTQKMFFRLFERIIPKWKLVKK